MRILILDDDPARHEAFAKHFQDQGHDVTHVSKFHDCCHALKTSEQFELAHLDCDLNAFGNHDLIPGSNEAFSGIDVAHIIAKMEVKPKRIIIHSWNPDGAKEMEKVLLAANVQVELQQFNLHVELPKNDGSGLIWLPEGDTIMAEVFETTSETKLVVRLGGPTKFNGDEITISDRQGFLPLSLLTEAQKALLPDLIENEKQRVKAERAEQKEKERQEKLAPIVNAVENLRSAVRAVIDAEHVMNRHKAAWDEKFRQPWLAAKEKEQKAFDALAALK